MATFLCFASFTGFCWTFDWTIPAIYAITFSPTLKSEAIAVSEPQPGQRFVSADVILQQAQQAFPAIKVTSLGFPQAKTEPFSVYGKSEAEMVYLDPYTASILKAVMPGQQQSLSLGDRITGSFGALHFGTFAGLASRILYVFVGFSPTILLITGFIMWWHHKPTKPKKTPSPAKLES